MKKTAKRKKKRVEGKILEKYLGVWAKR